MERGKVGLKHQKLIGLDHRTSVYSQLTTVTILGNWMCTRARHGLPFVPRHSPHASTVVDWSTQWQTMLPRDGCLAECEAFSFSPGSSLQAPTTLPPPSTRVSSNAFSVEWDNRMLGALKRHRTYPIAPCGDGGVADGTGFSERVTVKQTRPKDLTHSK